MQKPSILQCIKSYVCGLLTVTFALSLFLNFLFIARPGVIEYIKDPAPYEVGYTKEQRARLAVLAEAVGE